MTDTDERLGRLVRSWRQAAGLSQAQLAAAMTDAGVPGWFPPTVTKIEQGNRAIKLVEAFTLARVLGIEVAQLAVEPVQAPDDQTARRAMAKLRSANAALLGAARALQIADAELTYVVENLDVSAEVARRMSETEQEAGSEGAAQRVAAVLQQIPPDVVYAVERGESPRDDDLAVMHAEQMMDIERMK